MYDENYSILLLIPRYTLFLVTYFKIWVTKTQTINIKDSFIEDSLYISSTEINNGIISKKTYNFDEFEHF